MKTRVGPDFIHYAAPRGLDVRTLTSRPRWVQTAGSKRVAKTSLPVLRSGACGGRGRPARNPPPLERPDLEAHFPESARPDPYSHSGREGRPRLRVMLVVAGVDGVGPATTVAEALTP